MMLSGGIQLGSSSNTTWAALTKSETFSPGVCWRISMALMVRTNRTMDPGSFQELLPGTNGAAWFAAFAAAVGDLSVRLDVDLLSGARLWNDGALGDGSAGNSRFNPNDHIAGDLF